MSMNKYSKHGQKVSKQGDGLVISKSKASVKESASRGSKASKSPQPPDAGSSANKGKEKAVKEQQSKSGGILKPAWSGLGKGEKSGVDVKRDGEKVDQKKAKDQEPGKLTSMAKKTPTTSQSRQNRNAGEDRSTWVQVQHQVSTLHIPTVASLILYSLGLIFYIFPMATPGLVSSEGVRGGLWHVCGVISGLSIGGGSGGSCYAFSTSELRGAGDQGLQSSRVFSVIALIPIVAALVFWVAILVNKSRLMVNVVILRHARARVGVAETLICLYVLLMLLTAAALLAALCMFMRISDGDLYGDRSWTRGSGQVVLWMALGAFMASGGCLVWAVLKHNTNDLKIKRPSR